MDKLRSFLLISLSIRSLLIFVIPMLLGCSVSAQNIEWMKNIGSKTSDDQTKVTIAENDGGTTLLYTTGLGTNLDSLIVDTIGLPISNGSGYKQYIIRLDKKGKAKYIKPMDMTICTMQKNIISGEFFLAILLQPGETTKTINSTIYSRSNGAFLVACLDSNFNYKWVNQYGNSSTNIIACNVCWWNNKVLSFSENHLYFNIALLSSASIGSKVYNVTSGRSKIIFGELNLSNGNVIWSNNFNETDETTEFSIINMVSLKSKFFVSGTYTMTYLNSPDSNYIINQIGDSIAFGGFILRTNSSGSFEKTYTINNKFTADLSAFTTDGETLYIGGSISDTIIWGNKTILPQYQFRNAPEMYVASMTPDFKPLWFYQAKVAAKNRTNFGYRSLVDNIITNNGYIYVSARHLDSLLIDSNLLPANSLNNYKLLILKLDSLGNPLWATSGPFGGTVNSMSAKQGECVYICGYYNQPMTIGKHSISPLSTNNDGFVIKLSDFSITRGNIISGPYCAGDTIFIPYSKNGDFDSSNVFIAQLSNADGNFDQEYRELGRLKSDTNGIIIGQLPMFKVASSPNYRIRILSTAPAVQSYFKADSLRLLIYSRDKANPGPDTSICYGDTITLKTYGGTKWTWSPSFMMHDSNRRATEVWPNVTTKYKIIIDDSSGCGEPDTAYKTISILSQPNVTIYGDSTFCTGNLTPVKAVFNSGDSNSYSWRWYSIDVNQTWTQLKSQTGKKKDTLFYSPQNSDPVKIAIVLGDQCTKVFDTAFVTLKASDSLNVSVNSTDTAVCPGNNFIWKAKGSGGHPDAYQFLWTDAITGDTLSLTDSLTLKVNKKTGIHLLLTDACMATPAYQSIIIKVRDPLKTTIVRPDFTPINDTLICYGNTLKFQSITTGGDSNNYKYTWLLNDSLIAQTKAMSSNFKKYLSDTGFSGKIQLLVSDNCSLLNDTAFLQIKILPAIKIQANVNDSVCFGNSGYFNSIVKGGIGNYIYRWTDVDNNFKGNNDTLQFHHKNKLDFGDLIRNVIVNDGCSDPDTASAKVWLRAPLKVVLTAIDTCPAVSSTLTAVGNGGIQWNHNYYWWEDHTYLGLSGNTRNVNSPNKTKTYKVVVKDGCSIDSDTAYRKIGFKPTLTLNSDTTKGCEPVHINFSINTNAGVQYTWDFFSGQDNDSLSNLSGNSISRTYNNGTYSSKARIKTDFGCIQTASGPMIVVYSNPIANFSYSPNKISLGNPELNLINQSQMATDYLWNIPGLGSYTEKQPVLLFKDTGKYTITLIATNLEGCKDTFSVSLFVDAQFNLWTPNSFSPNNDAINDLFKPNAAGGNIVKYAIFNRWGECVFEGGPDESWDGTYEGEAVQDGLYIFTIEAKELGGTRHFLSGQILLIR